MSRQQDHIERRLEKLTDDVRELRSGMNVGFAALNTRLDGLHTRIDTLIDTIAATRTELAQHTHED